MTIDIINSSFPFLKKNLKAYIWPKVGVASATRHPAYSSRTYSNDIGVWILYYLRIHTCVCHLFVLSIQILSADFYWRSTNNLKQVIRLSRPVVFNQGIQPICLPSLAPSLVNATVSGIMLREWTVNKLKNEGEKWIYRYFKHFSYIQLINSTVCRSCNVHRWLGRCQVFVCF